MTAAVDNLKDSIYIEEVKFPSSYTSVNGITSYTTKYIGIITKGNYRFDIRNLKNIY